MYQVPRANCATHPGSGCFQTLKIAGNTIRAHVAGITREHALALNREPGLRKMSRFSPDPALIRSSAIGRNFSLIWSMRFLFGNDALRTYEISRPVCA